MQITVTKEEAKELLGSKVERLNTGVQKLSSLVSEEKWEDCEKVIKAFPTLLKTISSNIEEMKTSK